MSREARARIRPGDVIARAYVDYNAPPFPADNVTVTDAVDFTPLITKALIDQAALADGVVFYSDALHLSDQTAVGEGAAMAAGFARGVSDAAVATDVASTSPQLAGDAADAIGTMDDIAFAYGRSLAVVDAVGLADAEQEGIPSATYKGGDAGSNDASSFTISASDLVAIGASEGDLILIGVYFFSASMPINTTGWSTTGVMNFPTTNNSSCFLWRQLTNTDFGAGVTIAGLRSDADRQGVDWRVYAGPTTAVLRSASSDDAAIGTTITIPGFVPDVAAVGFVTYSHNRDNSPARIQPTGWTMRLQNHQVSASLGGGIGSADLLTVSDYVSGSDIAWTSEADVNRQKRGYVFELRA